MKVQEAISAKIHLGGSRKEESTSSFRSLTTLLNGQDSKIIFKESCLSALSDFASVVPHHFMRVILPLSGSLQITQANELYSLIPGASAAISGPYAIENSYKENEIHFLEITVPGNKGIGETCLFNLEVKNQLHSLIPYDESTKLLIGKFDGRIDGYLDVSTNAEVFIFIIGGVFEVQNRLLHERDALWVKGITKLEFEGLAQEGIILIAAKNAL
ncbi:MAG: hypothetical protein HYZ44_04290 [Bacteroidetes bacterium]|nr:hypothetical protein [Bacteroidota bacterium]